ncbi:MAG TPA: hypothetical protein VK633_05300 [Verrucomicrobiae bacterium]|nr:hypothetical protein [Verrucomicrobiae bacterium]
MSYVTVEVEINHGHIVAREPDKLPDIAKGLLTIFNSPSGSTGKGQRIQLPIIQGDEKRIINPTSQELDASLWAD